jgi:hypothetical protein
MDQGIGFKGEYHFGIISYGDLIPLLQPGAHLGFLPLGLTFLEDLDVTCAFNVGKEIIGDEILHGRFDISLEAGGKGESNKKEKGRKKT